MLPVMEIVLPHQNTSNVPAFLAKLWKMVDDPETNQLISWSDEGNSFIIHNQADFTQHLLPYYYKHSNMASFIRQLNMYGFHKVVSVESGGLKSEKQEEMEFAHPLFMRNNEHLLENIKRKVSTAKSGTFVPNMKSERVTEVLNEVNMIKDKQEDIDGKLDTMKKENEALWREVVNLRQKHQSQQKIVNKLIQFLVSLVQPRMGSAVKRRYHQQLAIEDSQPGAKEMKTEFSFGSGPVIKDVTNESPPEYVLAAAGAASQFRPAAAATAAANSIATGTVSFAPEDPVVETPASPVNNILTGIDPALINPAIKPATQINSYNQQQQQPSAGLGSRKPTPNLNDTAAVTGPNLQSTSIGGGASIAAASPQRAATTTAAAPTHPQRPVLTREISKEDFDLEMNNMQKDLDNLKDLLSGQITFDSNFISNLFNPEEPLANLFPGGELPKMQMDRPAGVVGPQSGAAIPGGAASALTFDDGNGASSLLEFTIDDPFGNNTGSGNATATSGAAAKKIATPPRREQEDLLMSTLNTPVVLADDENPMFRK